MIQNFGKKSTALEVLEGLDLSDKYFLITGGNTGIGFETARALALKNAKVTIACRNEKAANEAKKRILEEKSDAHVAILHLDNSDLKSVEACAEAYLSKNCPLHCLILNAGVFCPTNRETKDGFETTFQVNHLAHFLLTQRLEAKLIESAPARIIVVSSRGSTMVKFAPKDITWANLSPKTDKLNYGVTAYNISKFCNVLHASELNRRLQSKQVTAYSVHPGVVKTEIGRNLGIWLTIFGFLMYFFKTSEQGAATSVFLAIANNIESGQYYADCKVTPQTSYANNEETAKVLWSLSEEMLEHIQE